MTALALLGAAFAGIIVVGATSVAIYDRVLARLDGRKPYARLDGKGLESHLHGRWRDARIEQRFHSLRRERRPEDPWYAGRRTRQRGYEPTASPVLATSVLAPSGRAAPGQAAPGQTAPGPATSGQATSGQARATLAAPCLATANLATANLAAPSLAAVSAWQGRQLSSTHRSAVWDGTGSGLAQRRRVTDRSCPLQDADLEGLPHVRVVRRSHG